MKSPIYDVLPQHTSLSQSQLLQAQPPKAAEYELPNFITAAQLVAHLSVSDEDASGTAAQHVIALPFALPADQIVLKLVYAAAKPLETAGLSQIAVVGYDPTGNQDIAPPLPKNVSDVDQVFIAPRTKPRKLTNIQRTFSFVSEGDANGVLFALGTSTEPEEVVDTKVERRESDWKNPITTCTVTFTVSHGYYNKATMNNALATSRPGDGAPATCFWGGSAPVWFILDLKSWTLQMSHFTLRHGYHYDNSFPTDVVLYGANPEGDAEPTDADWVELWACKDPIFERSFQIRTFPVENVGTHFRYFKLLQKGNYTMGKSNAAGAPFLPICGLEVYGHLKYLHKEDDSDIALTL